VAAVVMNFGLLHLGRPERALAEACRVLHEGGRCAFTVWCPPEETAGFGIVLRAVGTHGALDVALPDAPPFFRFSDPAESVRALRAHFLAPPADGFLRCFPAHQDGEAARTGAADPEPARKMAKEAVMPKNILIFSDGTGQEGGRSHNTNIYKLFSMVEDRTPHQVAFYDRGVGRGMRFLTGLVGGRGFARNVRDCYEFLFRHFESEDRIFLFGFSRGAATVRSLAYFIHLFGILPHSRPELIPRAWRIYQLHRGEDRKARADAFVRQHHTMWAKVHFLGCYDTVAALGLPFRTGSVLLDGLPGLKHRFHNFDLSPSVVHARHALAIDDERRTFHPLLWNAPDDSEVKGPVACESLRQVWFLGMHTDVGGGYAEQELSDIPLVWLTQEAVSCGLRIWAKHGVTIAEDPDGVMHDSRGRSWARLYRRQPRAWDPGRSDRPIVHQSVLDRTRSRANGEQPPYRAWLRDLDHDVEPWVRYEQQPWYPTAGA
jgi:SAM-dependent methyltransferase